MLSFDSKGDFSKTLNYMTKVKSLSNIDFHKYGNRGVNALISSSPRESGLLSKSWKYSIDKGRNSVTINWNNTDIEGGCNVAILVQYGHAAKSGAYIKGVDFINPAMRPVFEEIANDIGKEIARL